MILVPLWLSAPVSPLIVGLFAGCIAIHVVSRSLENHKIEAFIQKLPAPSSMLHRSDRQNDISIQPSASPTPGREIKAEMETQNISSEGINNSKTTKPNQEKGRGSNYTRPACTK